jgi:hypothetical protein
MMLFLFISCHADHDRSSYSYENDVKFNDSYEYDQRYYTALSLATQLDELTYAKKVLAQELNILLKFDNMNEHIDSNRITKSISIQDTSFYIWLIIFKMCVVYLTILLFFDIVNKITLYSRKTCEKTETNEIKAEIV